MDLITMWRKQPYLSLGVFIAGCVYTTFIGFA